MRTFKHWTPRYIANRVRLMWYERRHPDLPWLSARAIQLLSRLLRSDDVGLEWGSGRSTAWLARHISHLTSVEHDPEWFERVTAGLRSNGVSNVDACLRQSPSEYVAIADRFGPESIDFCLVDGIERDLCAQKALSLLKPGGLLVIDNANWFLPGKSYAPNSRTDEQGAASPVWCEVNRQLDQWRTLRTSNGVWDTAIYIKS
jgi:predicted O-methyltransferase YrrM